VKSPASGWIRASIGSYAAPSQTTTNRPRKSGSPCFERGELRVGADHEVLDRIVARECDVPSLHLLGLLEGKDLARWQLQRVRRPRLPVGEQGRRLLSTPRVFPSTVTVTSGFFLVSPAVGSQANDGESDQSKSASWRMTSSSASRCMSCSKSGGCFSRPESSPAHRSSARRTQVSGAHSPGRRQRSLRRTDGRARAGGTGSGTERSASR
jgi:hypothetical protein